MKNTLLILLLFVAVTGAAFADTAPVSVRLPEEKAWVGQRLPFFIELRALGSFEGTASFDMPQIPGTIIIKTGNPVVSSEEIDGQGWFVQSHEFALFSQRPGALEIPPFSVRFSSRSGFTGPASDVQAIFPGMNVEIKRPPGSESLGFLVTSDSLEISETWTPEPKPVQAGAVFKRTILQRANQLSGMALSPPDTTAPESIRVYTEDPVIHDKDERGEFLGERSDTITYQMTRAGSFTLPELTYVWWNPKTEKSESKTLPAVNFDVSPAPSTFSAAPQTGVSPIRFLLPLFLLALGIWQRREIMAWLRQCWKKLHPADKVLAKKLLRACKQNDDSAAANAWNGWRNTQSAAFKPGPELQRSVLALHRYIFGSMPHGSWKGRELASAFTKHLKTIRHANSADVVSNLPKLNG